MSKIYKFRPTYTRLELNAIIQAVTESLRARVNVGDFDSPLVKQLASVKKYTERFIINIDDPLDGKTGKGQPTLKQPTIADKLRELGLDTDADALESGSQSVIETDNGNDKTIPTQVTSNAIYSPLDNPNLTDEEKYDALKLKDTALLTKEEEQFYLNVGTPIELNRLSKKRVSENDL